MTKEEFIKDLNEQLEKIPEQDFKVQYISIEIRATQYDWGHNVGSSYKIYEALNLIVDRDFTCSMGYGGCEERGYCNGDC